MDPTKFDFYAMDCHRALADNKMAGTLAEEVIQAKDDKLSTVTANRCRHF